MIKILNKYSSLIIVWFVNFRIFANPVPLPGLPPPAPPPPDMSIDDGLLVFLVFGLLFGFYRIYVFTVKKKRSI